MSDNKILDGMFGLCIGDALGVPVEFEPRSYLRQNPVTDMIGYGTHNQPKGTWSDDSSMALCLLDSLQYGYSLEDISNRFIHWYREALWTAHNRVFDIGITVSQSIRNLMNGRSPSSSGLKGELDNGNGSLMRILPMTFYLKDKNITERIQKVKEVSSITHGHDLSMYSCIFYVEYAINLLNGNDKFAAYEAAIASIKPHIEKNNCLSRKFQKVLSGTISQLPEEEIISRGYVLYTLEASLWCLLTSNSYEETVLKAVNLGDDTDTTAAVAGGLAGIYYGIESMPESWVNQLARKKDIETLCVRVKALLAPQG